MAPDEDDAASVVSLAASHDSVNSAPKKRKTRNSVRSKLERVRKGAEGPANGYNANLEKVRANWQCKVKDCLPVALVPRPLNKNGTCAGINEADKTRLRPHQWSKRLTEALATLTLYTAGDRAATIDMLSAEVARRQRKHIHKEGYAREVLVSDIIAVNAEIYRQKQQGFYETRTNEWRRLELEDMSPEERDLAGIGQAAPRGHAIQEWMRAQYVESAGLREKDDGEAASTDRHDGTLGEDRGYET
ncbi:hypothetical protein EJ03DRAFT_330360 [Teratosphaeria nubilosa]|uniref:Uncharacterized protein n=1 Tax=Teratosphaeria nubilosa TaxID=161662 RepID=A0A6G1L009_9PEZI|nr:hypothetical protein EJ03DRAFT_330360 [Teratosphaeria nubilosa]